MRISEKKLRSVVRNIIAESTSSAPKLGKGYGCVVYGESINFDSFVLRIVLDSEPFVKYAAEAVKMQEGRIISSTGGELELLAEFNTTTTSGEEQSPKLVAGNIAFYVGR